jgi:DNA-directed RNA polymerase subunit RPC12/RpoP
MSSSSLSSYKCAECGTKFLEKQFERNGLDLCSRKCNKHYYETVIKVDQERKEEQQRKQPIFNYKSVGNGGYY